MKTPAFYQRLALVSGLAFGSLSALAHEAAPTVINGNRILRSRLMTPTDRNGFTYQMAAVDGKVDFTGPGPVFVTLKNGGGRYTAPVDPQGDYTFFFEVDSSRIETQAWIPGAAASAVGTSSTNVQIAR